MKMGGPELSHESHRILQVLLFVAATANMGAPQTDAFTELVAR